MSETRFDLLPTSPFQRLNALLDGIAPGREPIVMSIGEPQHPYPSFINKVLEENAADYGRYPPIVGTADFRAAAGDWLRRRYGLDDTFLDPETQLLPVNGTREALFNISLVTVPEQKAGKQPAVLIPNPFYQCYAAAAIAAGAEPVYVAARAETGFLPDFAGLSEDLLAQTAAVYLCSPANPQGAVASLDYLQDVLKLAEIHDFTLIVDECYAEIYDSEPPPGALEAAQAMGNDASRLIVFHSLSKRSNLPGLRSGFCAGGHDLITRFRNFRNVAAPQTPLPVIAASAAAWREENHVAENRDRYRAKFDIAQLILGNRFGFQRPPGGFFLWLDVGDGETATRRLWEEAGVKVLPGGYLARDDAQGNPGAAYIRVALVDNEERTEEGLKRLAEVL